MRGALTTTLLLALLLALLVTDVCFANYDAFYGYVPKKYCLFDQLMEKHNGPLPVALVKEVPASGDGTLQAHTASTEEEGKWEPLRIKVSTKDLEEGGRRCTKGSHFQKIVSFEGNEYSCESYSSLEQRNGDVRPNIDKILKQAIKLHTDRLTVKRAKGKIVLPKFTTGVCQYFTVPEEYTTTGFDDADMVLFVGAIPDIDSITPGWAVPCAANSEGRPVAGAINLFPHIMRVNRHVVRSTAHQIAHALGFGHRLMQNLRMTDKLQVRTKSNHVSIVRTESVRQAVQNHYGCDTAHGMELEDGPHNNDTQSHWEQRNAKDELMADFFADGRSSPVLGLYSNLTLAAFHDMGFYRADFSMAEPMKYGRGAGCEFLQESCYEKNGAVKYPDMFCAKDGSSTCTTDRRSLGRCMMQGKDQSVSQWNFSNLLGRSSLGERRALTDFCPVAVAYALSCTMPREQSSSKFFSKNNRVGDDSWCLDGDGLVITNGQRTLDMHGICAEVQCGENDRKIKVRYQGSDDWHECAEGESIALKKTRFVSGSIKCPQYEEVCTVGKEGESLVKGRAEETSPATAGAPSPKEEEAVDDETSEVPKKEQMPAAEGMPNELARHESPAAHNTPATSPQTKEGKPDASVAQPEKKPKTEERSGKSANKSAGTAGSNGRLNANGKKKKPRNRRQAATGRRYQRRI